MRQDGSVTYYLPAGRWTHVLTGDVAQGPAWRTETLDAFSLPLFVKEGTILPADRVHPLRSDRSLAESLHLTVYELTEGDTAVARIPEAYGGQGVTFTARREADRVVVERRGRSGTWEVTVNGVATESAKAETHVDRVELPM
jgi:alpha-D-xyloside xylohydrolase